MVEVATSRGAGPDGEGEEGEVVLMTPTHLRGNIYGGIGEDVWRRTSANAPTNIADYSVWDYVGGMRDIEWARCASSAIPHSVTRKIRRMLRASALRRSSVFACIPRASVHRRARSADETVLPARLSDEAEKLLLGGCALATLSRCATTISSGNSSP
jgi:tRNA nucleotidyltransferase/poly(A) polymerase